MRKFLILLRRIFYTSNIILMEGFTTFWYVLPCAISWWLIKNFGRRIRAFSFSLPFGRTGSVAKLFLYRSLNVKRNENCVPLLFIHGDYSHPYTLHHLAKIALKHHQGPIFSLYIPNIHHQAHFNEQAVLIDTIICSIKKMVESQGANFQGILAAGHSKGAMLLIERQFYPEKSPEILRTFVVGGVLKNEENCFKEPLKAIFNNVYQKIQRYPERKFFQVIPKNDWVAPYKAMAVRPEEHCYSVPGMHLSGLYSKETKKLFKLFISS